MVDDFENHDDPIRALMDNRVEQSPERCQVLDKQVLYSVQLDQGPGYGLLPNDFPMKAIFEEDLPQVASSAGYALSFFCRSRIKLPERLGCSWRDQDLSCTRSAQSRTPLRMISRSDAEAGGTQRIPLLPSTMLPSDARKARAAFKLCREVEWPQSASCSRSTLRLIGSPFARKAARMNSIVPRVGFAPGRENSREGGRAACAMGYT